MECNKDEAGRALEIAERKLGATDLEGAMKMARRAQQLYPPLEGLSQIMAILDVHLAAQHKINGEMDWYGILQLHDAMAEESLVKKQYRKLALLLHPDKNKIVGAEGAFKLIVEAWGVLSDKIRRAIYDQKRKTGEFKHPPLKTKSQPPQNPLQKPKNPPQSHEYDHNQKQKQNQNQKRPYPSFVSPEKKSFLNVFPNAPVTTAPAAHGNPSAPNTTSVAAHCAGPGPSPLQGKPTTFWTVCHYCGMQYEYLRIYENQNLLCRNCQKPFLAVEATAIPISINGVSAFPWSFLPMTYPNNSASTFGTAAGSFSNGLRFEGFPNLNFAWGGPFVGVDAATASASASAAVAATVTAETVNVSSENVVGSEEEAAATKMRNGESNNDDEFDVDVAIKSKIGKQFFGARSQKTGPGAPSKSTGKLSSASCPFPSHSANVKVEPQLSSSRNSPMSLKGVSGGASFTKAASSQSPKGIPAKVSASSLRVTSSAKASTSPKISAASTTSTKKRTLDYNGDVGVVHRETRKEQQNKLFADFAYGAPESANRTDKPPVRQAPPTSKNFRDLLVKKAKMDILKNLSEVKRNAERAEALAAVAAVREEEEDDLKKALDATKNQDKGKKQANIEKKGVQNKVKTSAGDKKKSKQQGDEVNSENVEKPALEPQLITVPDSDFYDFDKDRLENSFETNQIWATYDDENGMPRFYARIVRVVSLNPFKVQMNWIEPKLHKYQTCGNFKMGKVISNDMLNIFSHVMKWEKSSKGVVTILPMKSEVWALYRDWDPTWDEYTPAEIRHKYEIVELLTDFTEEFGVRVGPLVKVSGFKNVFQKQQVASQSGVERFVSKTELLRFSHQIPAKRLTEEDQNVPEGCWELDPAATPVDILFQGTTEAGEKATQAGASIARVEELAGQAEEENNRS